MFFIQFTWVQSNRVLMSHSSPPSTTLETENQLARERITIGPAWDADTDHGLGRHHQATKKKVSVDEDRNGTENFPGEPESTATEHDHDDDQDSVNSILNMNEQMGFGTNGIK
jgi:hypothetical protein